MGRSELYPEIEPYETGRLAVDDRHSLYWEQSGNPAGVPVVFLHGGPGAGPSGVHRRFFDPAHYRIVIFDQRGAGRSTPLGEVIDNTTGHLIADIERLRETLGIARWIVFGGSWGSTLAIAYAEHHAERCMALALRGIFLCRRSEIDWFLYGMRSVFPAEWAALAGHLPEAERDDILANYHARLIDPDPAVHMPAARVWSGYEAACSTLKPDPDLVASFQTDVMALGVARLEAHYFMNDIFLPLDSLLAGADKLRGIPGFMVQGRYDMVCPIVTAQELHAAWPEAEYRIIDDAGHSALEPGIRAALVEAMEGFKTLS